jgi:hypothetical protein
MTRLRTYRSRRLRVTRARGGVRLRRAVFLTVLLTCVVALFSVSTAGAAEVPLVKSVAIDSLSVLLDVQESGDVVADETATYTFTGNYH